MDMLSMKNKTVWILGLRGLPLAKAFMTKINPCNLC